MYTKVPTSLNFVDREKEILQFWKENRIFEKSCELRKGRPAYTFYDGPPTANGKPHIGHILTRAMKDIIPRYRTMKGYDVLRKAGWDTHGLPVELEVEKMLGLDGKKQIEAYGVEPFIAKCKESVWKYKAEWEQMSDRVGYWADMEHPYVTYEDNYIESEWWALKTIYEKGLLYKGHKVVPYCPRCGTALASHEVAQGYKDVKEISATVRFKCTDEDASYLAWTTTPWTLPSNVCLCVNANIVYCRAGKDGEAFILAKDLVEKVLGEDAKIVREFAGSELVGRTYEPLFECTAKAAAKTGKKGFRIVADDYVSADDGTGIVHNAPAFGEDDYRVCRENDIPFVQMVDARGNMTEDTPWAGTFVKKADPMILKNLKESGALFAEIPFEHSYPFCWRCDTPLIYYARESWFIKMTAVRDKLIEYNQRINWLPETIKDGRMGNFLENVIDWGLSRERYWGTPLPVWVCEDCGHVHVVGSRKELCELAPGTPENIELHKPYLDPITFKCEKCGGTMRREKAVIDCWFDSGSMPFAQWHYPFENKEQFERRYPANYISEAIDQTRGWFYTLLAISTCLFDEPSYKNCLVLGLVADKDGIKMSKHKGNVVDPWSVLDKQGADAVRWYFYTIGAPWLPSRYSEKAVREGQNKFLATLQNVYAFFAMYADIDNFDPTAHDLGKEQLSLMDKWILSKLNTLIKLVDDDLWNYRVTEPALAIQDFVDELSNWYVRRGRERFWGKGDVKDKDAAFTTLYHVLVTLSKVCAPFIPFLSEEIYQNLVVNNVPGAPESVHLCDFPTADESAIDADMEAQMDALVEVVQLGRACRNLANIKTRQTAAKLYVKGASFSESYQALCEDELNVKEVVFTESAREFTTYQLKPQMRTLGPKYGKLLGKIGQHLQTMDGNDVVDAFERGETVSFDIDGTTVTLSKDDVLTSPMQKSGFVAQEDKGVTVVLDTNLTPELIAEGYVREVVSKVQTMRKDADFEVTDRIALSYQTSERLSAVIEKGKEDLMRAVLALSVENRPADDGEIVREQNINGEKATLGIKVVS